ncbi:CvpA family protein [Rufibacter tibetensis]|uniref:Colicin V production protein n=1 Tax=Rufibacter tibetensis TaxID=512763 RepID=A0A0P0CZ82_9BACT|nr:CvpA family protein [Rufibacter tibetensis]ALJ00067.1 colicin V production protein [Rufibacter tibetensis]
MNYIDLLILFIVLSSLWTGWYRGFAHGVLDLIRWVGSLIIGLSLYPFVAEWLEKVVDWNELWLLPISFFIVAVLASILIQAIGDRILAQFPNTVHRSKANQVLGLIPGFLSGLVTAAIVVVLLTAFPLPQNIQEEVQESALATRISAVSEKAEVALSPIFDKALNRTMRKVTVQPGSEEVIELPYKVTSMKPRPDLEAEMLQLVNEERAKQNLRPLAADTSLRRVARLHSEDMFRRGYFSHYTPEGWSPFDRIRKAKVPFRLAGENLALAPTLDIAHEGLMNSPGHRANILRGGFGRVGIGVLQGSDRRLMITQNFRN